MLIKTYKQIFNFDSKINIFFKKAKTSLYSVKVLESISSMRSSLEMLKIKSLDLIKSSLVMTITCVTWIMTSFVSCKKVDFFFTLL